MTQSEAVHLKEIAQVALTVANLEQAKAFYRDVLGMEFLFDAGNMAFFQCGSVRVLIGTGEADKSGGVPRKDGTILYFRMPDMQNTHATLKAQSVEFVQEPHLVARMKSHDLWLAFIKDPAGNVLGLMEEVGR